MGGGNNKFSGGGQSLGGSLPGRVIPIELPEAGPLGIKVEKRPNSNTAIVAAIIPGTQAERAGLERGDILAFQGSNGTEEIDYKMFLELAKSKDRPLCFEVRRLKTKVANDKGGSADSFARKQAMIAAAEAREKVAKNKAKPIPKTKLPTLLSNAEKVKQEEERLQASEVDEEPKSDAARLAAAEAKQNEAKLAAQLGYNPYEANNATSGQARTATVASKHGTIQHADAAIPVVAEPRPLQAASEGKPNYPCSPDFEDAFETAVISNSQEAVVASFGILQKLVVNATTKSDAKFRRVRLSNAKIKAAVVDVEGALDIMRSVGFEWVEEDGEAFLEYPADSMGPKWLATAVSRLETYGKS